jgi:uncharacterized protein YajQ (UPF0234 family)
MTNRFDFRTNETAFHRFDGERFTIVSCDGCVAVVRTVSGEVYPILVGNLTRRDPEGVAA